ncbi:leukocyte elastase inhibitor-like [Argiope bruennichi]|uniref:leukocyte elastase inhibitor-like n=1 Tax=Argiope bruennichi TaxID=94029 RepID=UPI0024945E17|nr:leukocyte elastase inhibitor-like [Argiope bruennichi]
MGANQSVEMTPEANHRLAINMMKTLAEKEPGDNICISPLSLVCTLSMLLCGACGDTASEIIEVLGLKDVSKRELDACFNRLLSSLGKSGSAYTLECANAAIIQQNFPIKDGYKKKLNSFRALLIQDDFAKHPLAVVDRINKWTKSKTHGVIDRLLDSLDPDTAMVLLNAIYFKGRWMKKFKKNGTSLGAFFNRSTGEKQMEMMHLKEEFDYGEFENCQALLLPYRGKDISMLILLPFSKDGLDDLEKKLTSDFVRMFRGNMQKTKVEVSLPRFRIEYFKSLKETFQQLGMRKAFDSAADLSGICDHVNFSVSDIIQKSVVEVNEDGTVAVAVTAAFTVPACGNLNEEYFIVDHPFLFTIYDIRNDTILFIGRIVELKTKSKTHGVIDRLLDSLDSDTAMVLLNAIYFKGRWMKKFKKNGTSPGSFFNRSTGEKQMEMMHLKEEFDYGELENCQALLLPYKGKDIAMLIMLPFSKDGLDDLERNLTPNFVRMFRGKMWKTTVKISLPRFRIEYFKTLKETFQQLGVHKAFECAADLSEICDIVDMSVSDIIHKAVIEVNEDGTVAAAVSAGILVPACGNLNEEYFIVDHPFLFTIYDIRNDTNLFIGRIVEL